MPYYNTKKRGRVNKTQYKKRRKRKKSIKKSREKKKNKTRKKSGGGKDKPPPWMQTSCAPNSKKNNLKFPTCYTSNSLHKLKEIWNARHPDVKIDNNDPKIIWQKLKSYMSSTCNTEACWLRHQCIKNDIDTSLWDSTFAPKSPATWIKKSNEWLNSLDIERVMKQYENTYKCFNFIGPSPVDFDKRLLWGECVWEELCKFQLSDELKKNKTKIGIIFNLDTHNKSGSHWVSMFINIKAGNIYYFDSYGDKAPKRILDFIKRVQEQATQLKDPMTIDFDWVSNRHQYGNSECGMYSLFFIIQLLKDLKNFNDFQENKYTDKHMKQLRTKYFNSHTIDSNLVIN